MIIASLLLQRIFVSATLAAQCTIGDVQMKSGASAGTYICTAPNTWTIDIPTSGGGDMLAWQCGDV